MANNFKQTGVSTSLTYGPDGGRVEYNPSNGYFTVFASGGTLSIVRAANPGTDAQGLATLDYLNNVRGQYDNTLFVDPNGDPNSTGKTPGNPTTYATAIASLAASTLVVLAEGTYSDGDGAASGTTTITQANVSFVSQQGGSGSNSVIIQDALALDAGRFRAFGVRFEGAITDTLSTGDHRFSACSSGATTFTRSGTASGGVTFVDCEFGDLDFSESGAAVAAILTLAGAGTALKSITCSNTLAEITVISVPRCGPVTMNNGLLVAKNSTFLGTGTVVNASATSVVRMYSSQVLNTAGAPQQITATGATLVDVVYDQPGSTITLAAGNASYFSGGVGYDNTSSGLAATTTQVAIDELQTEKREEVLTPTVTSSNAAASTNPSPITYTATGSQPGMKWLITDDDSTGVTIDYDSGVMSGGGGTAVGSYDIVIRGANAFGVTPPFTVTWTVS